MGKPNNQASFMFSQKINSSKVINNNQGEEGEVIID